MGAPLKAGCSASRRFAAALIGQQTCQTSSACVVGMAGMACLLYLYFRDPRQFSRSYLFAFVFWVGLPVGCLAIRMIHNLISGTWGFPLRRRWNPPPRPSR